MKDAAHIEIRNALSKNNRNGFRGEGMTYDVMFDNVAAYSSQDKYDGYNPDYLNGDGFIFEKHTNDLRFSHIISMDHWDSGFDIKGNNVVLEHIVCFGNKNGLKLWGDNIQVTHALIYGSKAQLREKGPPVDGMGIHVRKGSSVISQATIVNNETEDVKVGPQGKLVLNNSIVFRALPEGKLLGSYGEFESVNVVWFDSAEKKEPKSVVSPDMWADPQFVNWKEYNFNLKETSPAHQYEPASGMGSIDPEIHTDYLLEHNLVAGAFDY